MSRKDDQTSTEKEIEKPEQAVKRLTKEILKECRLIATGAQESCYTLVEKTKALMSAEDKLSE